MVCGQQLWQPLFLYPRKNKGVYCQNEVKVSMKVHRLFLCSGPVEKSNFTRENRVEADYFA